MLKYCLKKIGQLAIVMLLISFFSFAIIDLAPGDISSMYLTPDMTETERQLITEKLGLDKSMPEQYWGWLTEALQGNFGVSLSYNTPVALHHPADGRFPAGLAGACHSAGPDRGVQEKHLGG